MATKTSTYRLRVMLGLGIVGALLVSAGAAQDMRQDRVRARPRVSVQLLLPELVLLPEPILFPLQVPVPQETPIPQEIPVPQPAQGPPPAQVVDQVPRSLEVQPPDQFPPARQVRPRYVNPPTEQTALPELAPQTAIELAVASQQNPPRIVTFDTPDPLPPANPAFPTKDHPAVGAWFGQAIQVCPSGVAPSACNQGTPAYTLFMTPTLLSDGLFVADDTAALGGPPDGPHTTAFGSWVPTGATEFTADYMFMTIPFPYASSALAGLRARWVAKVIDAETMVGWVNAYIMPKTPITWRPLQYDEFPTLPDEALTFVKSPNGFVTDPGSCKTAGCPALVLKFTVKRIRR